MTESAPFSLQRIPRPERVAPGPPSPWAGLPVARRRGLSLDSVRAMLEVPFSPESRQGRRRGAGPRASAVLVALFDEGGESRVVLTRRASTLRSHRSEVSFPGGRVDDGETLVAGALREADEEIGIEPAGVEVIGTLTPLETISGGALIHPFIGLLAGRPSLRVNAAEVEVAFDVALADLLVDGVHRSERWGIGPVTRVLEFFDLPGDVVWGATGRVLWELLVKATRAPA